MRATLLVMLCFTASQLGLGADIEAAKRIATLLRPGEYKCEILAATPPDDVVDILARFQAAYDKEWFEAYSKAHPNKRPLPYHEKFGITEKEYLRIQEAKGETKLKPIEECVVTVTKNAKGAFELSGTKRAKCLDGLKIDAVSCRLEYQGISVKECSLGEPKKDAIVSVSSVSWNDTSIDSKTELDRLYVCIGGYADDSNAVFVNLIATKVRNGATVLSHNEAMRFFLSDNRTLEKPGSRSNKP